MAKNFYAVAKGKKPGIYRTWRECEEQVHGVNALFHGFVTYEEAVDFMAQNDAIEYAQAPDCSSELPIT